MNEADINLVSALVHDANVILGSDDPDNVGREGDLDGVKVRLRMAEKILAGNATDADRSAAANQVHSQTNDLFGLS